MNQQDNLQLAAQAAATLGLRLTVQQQQQFEQYLRLLLAWNEHINLTAIREPADIVTRHFLDSLSCSLVMDNLNESDLIDVGTGAGFPGLPLKILFPSMRLTLVDSVTKKTSFLRQVVAELGLTEVQIVTERAENLGRLPEHRDGYDWAVARAVAELRVLLEYLLPLCRLGGHVLAQKGESAQQEVKAATDALRLLGGELKSLQPVQLPGRAQPHYLVVIAKTAATPERYPRRVGVPGKRPL